jgi:hypothetical protein
VISKQARQEVAEYCDTNMFRYRRTDDFAHIANAFS